MARRQPQLPAISREVEFVASHENDVDAIYDEDLAVDPATFELVTTVYDRANEDVRALLSDGMKAITEGARGQIRIEWQKRASPRKWSRECRISMPKGRWRYIGTAGVSFDLSDAKHRVRLLSWADPGNGMDGRRELAERCRKKLPGVQLVSDAPERWPDWEGYDAVIYDIQRVTHNTARQDLLERLEGAARRFFAVAKPILDEISKK